MITQRYLIVAIVLLLFADLASACSCIPQSLTDQLDRSDLVMIVRVTSTRFDPESALMPKSHAAVHAGFDLVESLKGNAAGVSEVHSGFGDGDCGVELLAGRYYLVIADRVSSSVELDFCSASSQLRGFGPIPGEDKFQFRLDAIRAHIAANKPIDSCFDYAEYRPPSPAPPAKDRCMELELRLLEQARKKVAK